MKGTARWAFATVLALGVGAPSGTKAIQPSGKPGCESKSDGHYPLKRQVYRLELLGAPVTRVLCTVSHSSGASDTVVWDPEERRGGVRYALLPAAAHEADVKKLVGVAPRWICRAEPLLLKSNRANTVLQYRWQSAANGVEPAPIATTSAALDGEVLSDGANQPTAPSPLRVEVRPATEGEKDCVLKEATGLDNSTNLRSLDPLTPVLNDALTALATVALDRAKSAGKHYAHAFVKKYVCEQLTVGFVQGQLSGSHLSDAVDRLPWPESQPLLKNTCRLLDAVNLDGLVSSPDVVWKAFGMDAAELGIEILMTDLSSGVKDPEQRLRQALAAARALLISSLSDGATTTERDAQLLILQLGRMGWTEGNRRYLWSNGLEIGMAVLQDCLRGGICTADMLRQSLEDEFRAADSHQILDEYWPELPALIGRAADVLRPAPGTPARVTASNALALAVDVAAKVTERVRWLCVSELGLDIFPASRNGQGQWTCEAGQRGPIDLNEGIDELEQQILLCPETAAQARLFQSVGATAVSQPACPSDARAQAPYRLSELRQALQKSDGVMSLNLGLSLPKGDASGTLASLRGLNAALQGGDVATGISGLARMIANSVKESCEDEGKHCAEQTSGRIMKGFRILSALATYGASYRQKGDAEPDAELEKARADERRKAVEALIDAATDRTDRQGDWVFSVGADVALGASVLNARAANGRDWDVNANMLNLRTGLAAQRLSSSIGFHGMVSVLDLAQYAAVANDDDGLQTPKAEFATVLRIGLEAGVTWGDPSHPLVAALHGAWLPSMSFEGERSHAWVFGISGGVFVPFLDLN